MKDSEATLEEALKELRNTFLEGLPERLEEMTTSWAKVRVSPTLVDELKRCSRHFHSLAGTAGTFGFAELGDLARNIEDALRPSIASGSGIIAKDIPLIDEVLEKLKSKAKECLQETAAEAPKVIELSGSSNSSIAFLSDNQGLFLELQEQLGYYGYSVSKFSTITNLAEEAVKKKTSLLILDMELGTLSLSDPLVIEQLQKHLPVNLPKIIISDRTDWHSRLAAVRIGVNSYVQKPVEYSELADRLGEILHPQPKNKYRILIVEDQKELSRYYSLVLENAGMYAHILPSPSVIMETLDHMQPDLILMDLNMPECTGFELTQIIRQKQNYQGVPIVFLSGEEMASKKRAAMHMGGDDFLRKPIDNEELVFSVSHRAQRFRHLKSLMLSDSLTGLLNHAALQIQLENLLAQMVRSKTPLCFVMIDIDHFKMVNDKYGHPQGDAVLVSLTRLLQKRLRSADVIGRYGGEEFAIILPSTDLKVAINLVNELRENFSKMLFHHKDEEFFCTFSAGISCSPPTIVAQQLVDQADLALYASKKGGRNQVRVSQPPT